MRRTGRASVGPTHVHIQQLPTDERTKRSTQGKRRLSQCVWAQAVLQILKASLIAWAYTHQERVEQTAAAACAFAMVAIVAGRLGLERDSINYLKAYTLCMAIAAALAGYPLYKDGCKGTGWSVYQRAAPGQGLQENLKSIEGIQNVLNITTQVLGLGVAVNLLKNFTPEKTQIHRR